MKTAINLSLTGVEFHYSNTSKALDVLNLEINPGEWVALLGANGSGKSTLLRIIGALLLPTQGFCYINGQRTDNSDAINRIRQKIGFIFQNPDDQIVASTVEEDAAFAPENMGLTPEEIKIRVQRALKQTGLSEKQKSQVASLSGGEKQRLALAGVLTMEPDLLLLDEATSMLDPAARNTFMEIIKKEHKEGTTIIQVTHKLEEIVDCDRVVIMSDGHIAWQGGREEFFENSEELASKMKLTLPSLLKLKNILSQKGIIPEETALDPEKIEEQICLSR